MDTPNSSKRVRFSDEDEDNVPRRRMSSRSATRKHILANISRTSISPQSPADSQSHYLRTPLLHAPPLNLPDSTVHSSSDPISGPESSGTSFLQDSSSPSSDLTKDFKTSHRQMLSKRAIYHHRIDNFEKKRNNALHADNEPLKTGRRLRTKEGADLDEVKEMEDFRTIISLKEAITDDCIAMEANKKEIEKLLEKYPAEETSTSVNEWRKTILALTDKSLLGAKSMLKEIIRMEKISGLKDQIKFYDYVRNLEVSDRRDVCDNCFKKAKYFQPIEDKFHTFCDVQCGKKFMAKNNIMKKPVGESQAECIDICDSD